MLPRLLVLALFFGMNIAEEDIPRGHLQPLGSHKPPTVTVDEFTLDDAPRPDEFFQKYVKPGKPAIFRKAATENEAFHLWTDEYIRNNYGEMEVKLEKKHEEKHLPPVGEKYLGRDSLRHFADTYHDSDAYVISDLPSVMYGEVGVLPFVGACGEMSRRIAEVNLWWSGGGTSSLLHKDVYNQINCLLNGTKYWKLVERRYEEDIYKYPEPEYELGGFSYINPLEVDLLLHPNVSKIEWSNFTIHRGDCLFLPKEYYHSVISTGTHNLAVSILIGRFDGRESMDFSDCAEHTDYRTVRPLTDFDVQQTWEGRGTFVMGRSDLEEEIRPLLLEITKDSETVDFATFKSALMNREPKDKDKRGTVEKAFEIVDRNADGVMTQDEVTKLTWAELRSIADEIDVYEPSMSYNYEYSMITFERVWFMLQHCLQRYEVFDEETWTRHYRELGGTDQFAHEVFSRLSVDRQWVVSKNVGKSDVWFALKNWIKYWNSHLSNLSKQPREFDETELWEWANQNVEADFEDDDEAQRETVENDHGKNQKEIEDSKETSRLDEL